jgi:hypothetical protein
MGDNEVGQAIACVKQKDPTYEDRERSMKLLARRSKEDAALRVTLADASILKAFVRTFDLDVEIDQDLKIIDAALRCIANACADNDEARSNITKLGFSWAAKCLRSSKTEARTLAAQVVFNICNEFEPAQQQCYREGLHFDFLENCQVIPEGNVETLNDTIVDVLFLITGQKSQLEQTLDKPLSSKQLETILALPLHSIPTSDVDAAASSVEIALVYLQDKTVQPQAVLEKHVERVWNILAMLDSFASKLDSEGSESAEDMKIIVPLCSSITWCLSDMAALPEFATVYAIHDAFIEKLLSCISSAERPDDQAIDQSNYRPRRVMLNAACQMIGNVLWTTKSTEHGFLVEQRALHRAIFAAILLPAVPGKTSDLLFSSAGLLIHLTRSSTDGKDIIGSDDRAEPALRVLCRHPMEQIKHEGIRLLKALCIGHAENQKRFGSLAAEVTAKPDAVEQTTS